MNRSRRFPDGFLWGAATSAYQVEGSPLADGAGPSNWHRFSRRPGAIAGGDTGDVACDHYARFRDDVALMRELGLTAYRFSVSWSRVLPAGRGPVNERGLDFYRRLVDALREAGIRPFPTLYHWDLPAALDDRGGWTNPDVASWFADYARVLYASLDGPVEDWTTLNEPWVVVDGGYVHGTLAPGRSDLFAAVGAARNLMRAHGEAVRAYRADGRHRIGLVVNVEPKDPASDSPEDAAAVARSDAYMNRQFLDPALLGTVPRELAEVYGEAWEEPTSRQLDEMRAPLDFLGLNYYTRGVVRHDPSDWPERASRVPQPGKTLTEMGWEVFPEGLRRTLVWLTGRYGRPALHVTENGAAFYDPPLALASPHPDPLRVAYLRDHLRAAREAIADGVDLRGYFAWSLLDNLEWSAGFSRRFGIVHVDRQTQERTPKESARFYAGVIATNGEALPDQDA